MGGLNLNRFYDDIHFDRDWRYMKNGEHIAAAAEIVKDATIASLFYNDADGICESESIAQQSRVDSEDCFSMEPNASFVDGTVGHVESDGRIVGAMRYQEISTEAMETIHNRLLKAFEVLDKLRQDEPSLLRSKLFQPRPPVLE